jgi:hypothetical protein
MPKFGKNDRVRAKVTLFDEGTADRNGVLFSQKWAAKLTWGMVLRDYFLDLCQTRETSSEI